MERTVTVSVRGLLVTGLVLVALLSGWLLGGAGGPAAGPAQASTAGPGTATVAAGADARTLRMVGEGEATVVPDQLGFTVTVTAEREALEDALGASSATQRRVLDALAEKGVRREDVQTTGLQMHPEHDYPSYGPPVLTGYRVTQRARVVVREVADGGRAVSAAVAAGGDRVRVTDIRLGVSDPEAALGRARDAAVAAATAKAERYAAATGQRLGEVLGLREVRSVTPRPAPVELVHDARDAAAQLAPLPVRAGRDGLVARVEVVWAFE